MQVIVDIHIWAICYKNKQNVKLKILHKYKKLYKIFHFEIKILIVCKFK